MKKLMLLVLAAVSITAFAVNIQPIYKGDWESTVNYKVNPVYGSSLKNGSMVRDASSVYITNGTTAPTVGTHPASQSAAWDKIGTY